MNSLILYVVISLLVSAWVAADAAPHAVGAAAQSRPGVAAPTAQAAPAARNLIVANEPDYALTLKDPFSPIGYHLPMSEWRASADVGSVVSNMPPPSGDLKTKAKDLLRVRGVVKRGNKYVANINGAIVNAGDEIGITVDGQVVVFVVRAISLERVQVEPRE